MVFAECFIENRDLDVGFSTHSIAGRCLLFDRNRVGKWAILDNEGAQPVDRVSITLEPEEMER